MEIKKELPTFAIFIDNFKLLCLSLLEVEFQVKK